MDTSGFHEAEPLYNKDLEALDTEHVAREVIRPGIVTLNEWWTWLSISSCFAVMGVFVVVLCGAIATSNKSREQIMPIYHVHYDFVGEGNCQPNRPQWAKGGVPYDRCHAVCDNAPACIGFDWDADHFFCRVRFASNDAIELSPVGFEAGYGIEGDRLYRRNTEGIIGIEGSHTAGCFQKALSIPFRRFLEAPSLDTDGNAVIGPLPNIFDYYKETGLSGPLKQASKHMMVRDSQVLEYNGSSGSMILPSLDAVPLLGALRRNALADITIMVGINSDSYNYGLGVVIEASPQMNESLEHRDEYIYNGLGVHRNTNVIKFHPDYPGGQVRVEGPGGFADTDIGFTPPGWTNSAFKLNMLEITTREDGNNEVLITSALGQAKWRQVWRHKLFDGKDIPTVYAFMDYGGEKGKPLMVGQVSLKCRNGPHLMSPPL